MTSLSYMQSLSVPEDYSEKKKISDFKKGDTHSEEEKKIYFFFSEYETC